MTNPYNVVALFIKLPECSVLKLKAGQLRSRLQLKFYRVMKNVIVFHHYLITASPAFATSVSSNAFNPRYPDSTNDLTIRNDELTTLNGNSIW